MLQFIDEQVVMKILVDGPNIITADISKGYKQILVDQMHSAEDRCL